jgi:hypothetical protein
MTINWTIRENVRAQLRFYMKRIPHKYGYRYLYSARDREEKVKEVGRKGRDSAVSWAIIGPGRHYINSLSPFSSPCPWKRFRQL